MDPFVQCKDHGDGSADFTLSFAEDDHRFGVSGSGDTAIVEYEETHTWRGQIMVSEPAEEIFKELMTSDEMTRFLDDNEYTNVRRER